jgi:hypothetical protein
MLYLDGLKLKFRQERTLCFHDEHTVLPLAGRNIFGAIRHLTMCPAYNQLEKRGNHILPQFLIICCFDFLKCINIVMHLDIVFSVHNKIYKSIKSKRRKIWNRGSTSLRPPFTIKLHLQKNNSLTKRERNGTDCSVTSLS